MVVPPHARAEFIERMAPVPMVPIGIDTHGSVILHG